MWPNAADRSRCPVATYISYKEKRPASYSAADHPFYLAINTKLTDAAATAPDWMTWFKRQPVGQNKLATIMPKMTEKAGMRRLTNHSARKHLVQKLSDHGIPANQIMQVTGHRNIHSINNYSAINLQQQREISNVIAHGPTATVTREMPEPVEELEIPELVVEIPELVVARPQAIAETPQAIDEQHLPSTSSFPKELFRNCNMRIDNMTVNVVNNYQEGPNPTKRRRIINAIESDSDD
jgi:hypothetical protein